MKFFCLFLTILVLQSLHSCVKNGNFAQAAADNRYDGAYNADHALLHGAKVGDFEMVRHALEIGAFITAKNNNGVSALIWATNNGHLEIVKLLLEKGAKIEDRSNNLRTSLIWACHWGHLNIVEYLLEKGANLHAFDDDGMTPLMSAVLNGNKQIVQLLLSRGAEVTEKNFFNGTALSIARVRGYKEIELMLEPFYTAEHSDNPYVLMFTHLWAAVKWVYEQILEELKHKTGMTKPNAEL